MAPKKITGYVKLQIMAGKATPAPPVGPALGQAQVNIMEFCKQFNDRTKGPDLAGLTDPRRHQRLCGSHLQLHHQDASGARAAPEGRRHREGLRHSEQGEEGQGHREADHRHRHTEDAGYERDHGRSGSEDYPRHRSFHGYRSRRLTQSTGLKPHVKEAARIFRWRFFVDENRLAASFAVYACHIWLALFRCRRCMQA